jgi:4-hydroxy-3-methylbut-2-enyl diphosphate reductase
MSSSRRILLAQPRGFCAGVDRALEIVDRALARFGTPIYVKHEIVHNKHVVAELAAKGVIFVEELDEVPDGAVLIFSAHGVSKAVRAEAAARSLAVIDATCPLVTKVHGEVARHDGDEREIILIGHPGHVEVIGTMGQLPAGRIKLVRNEAEAQTVEIRDPDRVAYVTQTTLSSDESAGIIRLLQRRFPAIQGPARADICYATQNRQTAVKRMAGAADLILVIGSKNSSNSNRLVEVARAAGVAAHLIDHPDEIRREWLDGITVIGVTAGASAPERLVQETLDVLKRDFGGEVEVFRSTEETVVFPLPKEIA